MHPSAIGGCVFISDNGSAVETKSSHIGMIFAAYRPAWFLSIKRMILHYTLTASITDQKTAVCSLESGRFWDAHENRIAIPEKLQSCFSAYNTNRYLPICLLFETVFRLSGFRIIGYFSENRACRSGKCFIRPGRSHSVPF